MRLELRGTSRNRGRERARQIDKDGEHEDGAGEEADETESTDSTFFSANRLLN